MTENSQILRYDPASDALLPLDGAPASGDAAPEAPALSLIAVPTERARLMQVTVPVRGRKALLQAIPFALEDELAEDIETQTFLAGRTGADGATPVCVLDTALAERLRTLAEDAGLEYWQAIPDALLLPGNGEEIHIATEDDRAVVRSGTAAGFACPRALFAVMGKPLAVLDGPQRIVEWPLGSAPWPEVNALGLPVERRTAATLADCGMDAGDLERFGYLGRRPDSTARFSQRTLLAAAAAIAGLAIVVTIAAAVAENLRLERRSAALKAEMAEVFASAFPEVGRIVEGRELKQAETELAALRGSGPVESSFLPMLIAVGEALTADRGLSLQGVTYRGGKFDLQLQGDSIGKLEAARDGFEQRYVATLINAEARAQGVSGRIRLEPR